MSCAASFRVGDKVVYPNQGVGVIELISRRPMGESVQEFYLLRIESSNLRVMVPSANAATIGLRAVSQAGEWQAVLHYLEERTPVAATAAPNDWKGRFKENSEKMRDGTLLHLAEVLKGLAQLHQGKPLSYREKKMLDRAALLLANEMASMGELSSEQALTRLQAALDKAGLSLPPLDPEE